MSDVTAGGLMVINCIVMFRFRFRLFYYPSFLNVQHSENVRFLFSSGSVLRGSLQCISLNHWLYQTATRFSRFPRSGSWMAWTKRPSSAGCRLPKLAQTKNEYFPFATQCLLITCSWTQGPACITDIAALYWGTYGRFLSLLWRVWRYTIADLNLLVVCWWINVCDWLNMSMSNNEMGDQFASKWLSESMLLLYSNQINQRPDHRINEQYHKSCSDLLRYWSNSLIQIPLQVASGMLQ